MKCAYTGEILPSYRFFKSEINVNENMYLVLLGELFDRMTVTLSPYGNSSVLDYLILYRSVPYMYFRSVRILEAS
jgi:hypothetical protein